MDGMKFIEFKNNNYELRNKRGEVMKGNYEFKDGVLMESGTEQEIGRFSCDPIATDKLAFPSDPAYAAVQNIRSIGITDSEIMSEIQKPSSQGAYFVLPSQLNGAEYPSHHSVVNRLQDYTSDNTGGPRGQLAVHPAAGQFVIDNAANERNPGGINAIDAILEAAPAGSLALVNGYLRLPMPKNAEEAAACLRSFQENLHTLRPLVMAGVQACGLTPDKGGFSGMTHKVNLVYASAVPVNAYLNQPRDRPQERLHENIAVSVLIAQYYGALKTAAARSATKTKVFLMPLGGGVFNNSWESIAKSMSVAVEMLTPDEHAKLDIQVLTWNGNPSEKNTMERLLTLHQKLA